MCNVRRYLIGLLWLSFIIAWSRPAPADEASDALCVAVAKVPIPAKDRPNASDRKRLSACVSTTLYFAAASARDFRDARLCAFLERDASAPPLLGGAHVLMMIYANAKSVPRNLDLARRFACEVYVGTERDGQLAGIAEFAKSRDPADELRLCGYFNSGFMMGECGKMHLNAAKVGNARYLRKLQAGWPPAKRRAFAVLHSTANDYFEARMYNEIDNSGSARGQLIADERMTLNSNFLEQLDTFESGTLPRTEPEALALAETALSAAYKVAIEFATPKSADEPAGTNGSVTPKGIQRTQEMWQRYRDAWADFAAAHYPGATRKAFLLWQTRERTALLRGEPSPHPWIPEEALR